MYSNTPLAITTMSLTYPTHQTQLLVNFPSSSSTTKLHRWGKTSLWANCCVRTWILPNHVFASRSSGQHIPNPSRHSTVHSSSFKCLLDGPMVPATSKKVWISSVSSFLEQCQWIFQPYSCVDWNTKARFQDPFCNIVIYSLFLIFVVPHVGYALKIIILFNAKN